MSETGTARILSKKQKEEHKEEIVKWLLENYVLAADRALPRDVVYQHYCSFCRQKGFFIGGRSFFTKIFAVPFPCLPSRRLGARGDTRLFYDGLDIHPNSDFYSKVARERLVMPQPMSSGSGDSTRKVCHFHALGSLHTTKHLPVTVSTVDIDLHHLNTPASEHGHSPTSHRQQRPNSLSQGLNSKRAAPEHHAPNMSASVAHSGRYATVSGVSQDRLDELDHLLSPTEANDQILEFLNLSGGTEEQISKMAEELLSQDAQGNLSDLMMGTTDFVRNDELDKRKPSLLSVDDAFCHQTQQHSGSFKLDVNQSLASPLLDNDSPHSSSCSNDSGISVVHDDVNSFSPHPAEATSSPLSSPLTRQHLSQCRDTSLMYPSPATALSHSPQLSQPSQSQSLVSKHNLPTRAESNCYGPEKLTKRLKTDAMDLNSNSVMLPLATEPAVSPPLRDEEKNVPTWNSLSDEHRKFYTERVMNWLDDEYDIAPMVCVPRQTVYKHYQAFCGTENQPVANIKVFGKILQKKFPSLSMRRLGGRGESRYFYMGIDIMESSCHYAIMRDQRIFGTKDKPKRSLVTFDKRAIKNSII